LNELYLNAIFFPKCIFPKWNFPRLNLILDDKPCRFGPRLGKNAFGTLIVGKSSCKEKCSGKAAFGKTLFMKNS